MGGGGGGYSMDSILGGSVPPSDPTTDEQVMQCNLKPIQQNCNAKYRAASGSPPKIKYRNDTCYV